MNDLEDKEPNDTETTEDTAPEQENVEASSETPEGEEGEQPAEGDQDAGPAPSPDIRIEAPVNVEPPTSFQRGDWEDLKITQPTIELLEKEGFLAPTPVQKIAVPFAMEGRDLLVSAKTGSGKTATFCLPLIEKIRGRTGTLALILCPTREIALQTQTVMDIFGTPQGIKSMSVIGGSNMRLEEKALKEFPQVICGTPGRICDHLERGNLWLEYLDMVILDEADRMLEMGFAKELNTIMDETNDNRQTLFFSATMTQDAENLAKRYLYNSQRISIGSSLRVADTIAQELLWVNRAKKKREILRLLQEGEGTFIIFTGTKTETLELWRFIHSRGFHDSEYLSSDKAQKYREKTVNDFKAAKIRILVTTDVAGRGIDVENVSYVINYDFPRAVEDYIHRVGRTGRKERKGKAVSLVTPGDARSLVAVEKVLGKPIDQSVAYDFDPKADRRGGGGRGGSSGGARGRSGGGRGRGGGGARGKGGGSRGGGGRGRSGGGRGRSKRS